MTEDLSRWRIQIVPNDWRERGDQWIVYAPGCSMAEEAEHEPGCGCAAYLTENAAWRHVPVGRARRRIAWMDLREAS